MTDRAPFAGADGSPRLTRCAVLFVDLLGVHAMAEGPDSQAHLVALERALRSTYRDFLQPGSAWPAAMFSDTLVVAAPVVSSDDESALGGLVLQATWLQQALIWRGLFVRGALTIGDFHILDGLLYGQALVDAYRLESTRAIHPRIVLGTSAAAALEQALGFYADPTSSPQNLTLMRDDHGYVFINYLEALFDEPYDVVPYVDEHRRIVQARLRQFRQDRQRWEKYRWVAEYHNYVAHSALSDHPELAISSDDLVWGFRPFAAAPA